MNRKKLLLAGVLAILLLAIISSYIRFPRQRSVAKLTYGPGSTAQVKPRNPSAKLPLPVSGNLRLDLLDRGVTDVVVHRDILKPIFLDEAHLQAQLAKKRARIVVPPPPPPTSKEIARQQLARFKSLGMLRKAGVRTAFLARGEEILLVRLGDKPLTGYHVTGITDEALYLKSLEGDDEIRFPLR